MDKVTGLLLVTGMHRSGTSAIAGGLAATGVGFGASLMPPAADNRKGFFEDTRIVSVNEKLLGCNLQAWDAVAPARPLPPGQPPDGLLADALAVVRSLGQGGVPTIGIKDPRISLFAPFWQEVLAILDIRASWLVCLRHPSQVAKSLYDRNRFSRSKSFALWLKYNLSLLQSLSRTRESTQVHLLNFDDLCADAALRARQAQLLLTGTGLAPRPFVDFFDTRLTSPEICREPRNDLEELAIIIHDSLASCGMPASTQLVDWVDRWQRLEPALSLIDLQYQHYAQFTAEEKRWVRELEATVEARDKELERLGDYTRELLAILEEQRSDGKKLEAELRAAEKDKMVTRRELAIALTRAKTYYQSASELEEVLSTRTEQLAQQDQAIQSLQRELAELYASTSWRVSYPIRALRRTLRRFTSLG